MSTVLLPYLRLVRLPAVFTALTNVIAGRTLAGGGLDDWSTLGPALIASGCLYLAGMALNDLVDRDRDAVDRPERPLPSGTVSPRAAAVVVGLLGTVGIAAACVAGPAVASVAGVLTVAIVGYDCGLKRTPLGPLAMGLCRTLNVLLGVATVAVPAIGAGAVYAVALGLYIAAVTAAARFETSRVPPALGRLVAVATVVMLLTLVGLAVTRPFPGSGSAVVIPGVLAAYLAVAAVAFGARGFLHPTKRLVSPVGPGDAPRAVGALIGSIAWFDAIAVLARTTSLGPLAAVAVCVVASRIGRKLIPIS